MKFLGLWKCWAFAIKNTIKLISLVYDVGRYSWMTKMVFNKPTSFTCIVSLIIEVL